MLESILSRSFVKTAIDSMFFQTVKWKSPSRMIGTFPFTRSIDTLRRAQGVQSERRVQVSRMSVLKVNPDSISVAGLDSPSLSTGA
jgi:hypothetical protein